MQFVFVWHSLKQGNGDFHKIFHGPLVLNYLERDFRIKSFFSYRLEPAAENYSWQLFWNQFQQKKVSVFLSLFFPMELYRWLGFLPGFDEFSVSQHTHSPESQWVPAGCGILAGLWEDASHPCVSGFPGSSWAEGRASGAGMVFRGHGGMLEDWLCVCVLSGTVEK